MRLQSMVRTRDGVATVRVIKYLYIAQTLEIEQDSKSTTQIAGKNIDAVGQNFAKDFGSQGVFFGAVTISVFIKRLNEEEFG
jgi:hypothetical protein